MNTSARRMFTAILTLTLVPAALAAQAGGETYSATASVKTGNATASKTVTFHVDRFLTDAERDKLVPVVKSNDNAAILKALNALPDIGYVAVGDARTPVKYAYARPTGSGRMVTIVTAKPLGFIGGNDPGAKAKDGYELGIALLILDASGRGDGEVSPAARVKVDANGAIVTSDYAHEVVRLTGISKK
jgi:hypothetical protein